MSNLKRQKIRTIYPTDAEIINSAATNFSNWAKHADPVENQMMAERVIDDYLTTFLPSANTATSVYNWESFRKDLEYLNRKLSVLRKTITSWDTYQINEVVTDKNILASRIASLTPNSGLLVNLSQSLTINGETYGRGDIVYADSQGTRSRIPAKSGGYYYPYAISSLVNDEEGGEEVGTASLQIEYHFAANNPSEGESIIKTSSSIPGPTPAKTMKANVALEGDNAVYNTNYTVAASDTVTFNLESSLQNSFYTVIYPYIRFFYQTTNADGTISEEEIQMNSGAIKFKGIPSGATTSKPAATCTITNITPLSILVKVR